MARGVSYLEEKRARKLSSRVLSTLAVRSEDDPLTKVERMIKDPIVRLMEEANEESEHKGWCDTELGTNEQTCKGGKLEMLRPSMPRASQSSSKATLEILNKCAEAGKACSVAANAAKSYAEQKLRDSRVLAKSPARRLRKVLLECRST